MRGQFEHDTPAEREKRIDRMMEHIRHAEYVFGQNRPKATPTPPALIWLLLEDAMHTVRSIPDKELAQVSRVKTLMPSIRFLEIDAYRRAIARLEAGMAPWDTVSMRRGVGETDIDRMVDVLDLLRFVTGRDADRLRKTVLARAAGLTIQQCGWIWDRHRIDFDRRAMHDLKQRVIGQILKGLADRFGLIRTGRSFRRHIVREIERRKKHRKEAPRDEA